MSYKKDDIFSLNYLQRLPERKKKQLDIDIFVLKVFVFLCL